MLEKLFFITAMLFNVETNEVTPKYQQAVWFTSMESCQVYVSQNYMSLENGLKMYLEVNKMTDSIEGIFCVGLTKEEIKEMFGLESEPAETLNT